MPSEQKKIVLFFHLHGPFEASFCDITFGRRPLREKARQDLQNDGRQPRPPPLQIGINAKLQRENLSLPAKVVDRDML